MGDLRQLCLPPTVLAPEVPWSTLHLPMPTQSSPSSMYRRCAHLQDNVLQNQSQMNGHRSCLDEVVVVRRVRGEKAVAEQKEQMQEILRLGKQRALDPVGHGAGFVTLKQRYTALLTKAQHQEAILEEQKNEIRARRGCGKDGVPEINALGSLSFKTKSIDDSRISAPLDVADPHITRRQKLFGDGMPNSAREAARRSFQPQPTRSGAPSRTAKPRLPLRAPS
eukprot:5377441-Amphidinium_carterae.1